MKQVCSMHFIECKTRQENLQVGFWRGSRFRVWCFVRIIKSLWCEIDDRFVYWFIYVYMFLKICRLILCLNPCLLHISNGTYEWFDDPKVFVILVLTIKASTAKWSSQPMSLRASKIGKDIGSAPDICQYLDKIGSIPDFGTGRELEQYQIV